jgi:predicted ABC-type ATPase
VPPAVIRRRYQRGVSNFIRIYLPPSTRWRVYDNSAPGSPRLVSQGGADVPTIIRMRTIWECILKEAGRGGEEGEHV